MQKSHPKVLNPTILRACLADYWARFLQQNYARPEEVSVAFGVTYQTACNWWEGLHKPLGDKTTLAGRAWLDFVERQP
ncbi:hypothetical protein CN97_00870 [Haematobacter massiliensis]|uniref:Uncharacterized protein n=1 Tax=Haematobacter massiliensis TaxID=195105 RepID=A0A086Y0J4_9RHOB|nr:hypothetical protein [Haematobacter massiliensis]KFI27794.1 hypothetical protein CN97_00870 [Haematobacter massiliensis]OWJ82735.1 hypothetical protein CDV51_17150 [Haematobacter massiliensis]